MRAAPPPMMASDAAISVGHATADFKTAKVAGFDLAEMRIREFVRLMDANFSRFAAECRSNGLPLTTGYGFRPNDS